MFIITKTINDTLETGDVVTYAVASHQSLKTAIAHVERLIDTHHPDDPGAYTTRDEFYLFDRPDASLPVFRMTRYPDDDSSLEHYSYDVFDMSHLPACE